MTAAITQANVDHVTRIARKLGRTPLGCLAGTDELESEALVVLWDLALSWDEAQGIPFDRYITMRAKHRLIDWLRTTFGRHGTPKLSSSHSTLSLDYPTSAGTPLAEEVIKPDLRTPEEVVVARSELAEVWSAARQELNPRHQDVLRADLIGDQRETLQKVAERWEMSVDTAYTHRSQARRRLRDLLK
jgi:RNA polymerase sigma factor (sigma-70 family)